MEVPAIHHDPWLINRDPQAHAIIERAKHDVGILAEPGGDVVVAIGPPAQPGPPLEGAVFRRAIARCCVEAQ